MICNIIVILSSCSVIVATIYCLYITNNQLFASSLIVIVLESCTLILYFYVLKYDKFSSNFWKVSMYHNFCFPIIMILCVKKYRILSFIQIILILICLIKFGIVIKVKKDQTTYIEPYSIIENKNSNFCCICHDNEDQCYVKINSCSHVFHNKCLGVWLNINSTCPLCRIEITTRI